MSGGLRFGIVGLFMLVLSVTAQQPDAYRQAAAMFGQGDLAGAERLLQAHLKSQPNDASAMGLLGAVLDSGRRFPEAEPVYQRALALAPNSATLWNNYGNHQLATGNAAGAKTSFLKAVAIEPARANANLQLASLAVSAKNGVEALSYLNRLAPADRSAPEVALLAMQALYLSGQTAEADRLRGKFLAAAQQDPRLSFSTGLALATVERYEDAETCFARVLQVAPNDFDVQYNLGLAAFHAGHLDRAREMLEAAHKNRPQDVDTLYNLAVVDIQANQRDAALGLLAQAVKLAPERPNVQLLLAQTASALGLYGDALPAYEKYGALNPKDETVRRELGFLWAATGQREKGLQELRTYLKAHPQDATAHYELGISEAAADPVGARQELERAIASQPDFVPARFGRGVLQFQSGDAAGALNDFTFAAQKYPDNPEILDRLGQAYLSLGRAREAAETLQRAAAAAPQNPRVLMHLSRALSESGQKDEAHAVLDRFRVLGATNVAHVPAPGMVEFLGLSPEQQAARYRDEVQKRLAKDPQDASVHLRYLKLLLDDGRVADARTEASRLLELHPAPALLADAGRALLDAGEYESAAQLLKQAGGATVELAMAELHTRGAAAGLRELERVPPPHTADFYAARAVMRDAAGEKAEALQDVRELQQARAAAARPESYDMAAKLLVKYDQHEEAVRLMTTAAKAYPDSPKIALLHAGMLLFAQKLPEAQQLLQQIEARWPDWGDPYATYGVVLEAQKHSAEAKAQLETAVALGAHSGEMYYALAKSTLAVAPDRLDDAAKSIAQAVAALPDDPWVQSLAGRIAFEQHQYAQAVTYLQRAIALRPSFLQPRYRLAQAYSALGQKDDAARVLAEFRKLREQNPNADDEVAPAQ